VSIHVAQTHAEAFRQKFRARLAVAKAARGENADKDYGRDPVGWINERLKEHLWSKQIEIANAIVDNRRVVVPSAHDVGKSFLAARLTTWWIDSHPPGEAFVVTTAPTWKQVRVVLWREINKAHAKGSLIGRMNQTEMWIDRELVAFGQKPADYDSTAFQGIHARWVLVLIDEGAGVPELLYQAAASLAANEDSRILAIGNPTDPLSYFAKICKPGSGWRVIPIDGLESPNFTEEPIPEELRPYLLSHTYEKELRDEFGEDSPVYQVRIRGRFPENAEDGVILYSWLTGKCQNTEYEPKWDDVHLGLDVGAGGDETNIWGRAHRVAFSRPGWKAKTPEWTDAVNIALKAIRESDAKRIKIDMIGVGWGVYGRLKELYADGTIACEPIGVNVGEAATEPEKYAKLRSQIWWEVGRGNAEAGSWDLTNVPDTVLAQLISPKYKRDTANKIQVEPKANTRKEIGRSPDDADALLLAFFEPPPPAMKRTMSSY
jgi:hypothetical protein